MPFKTKSLQQFQNYVNTGDKARDVHDWPSAEVAYRTALEKGAPVAAFNVQLGHSLKEQGRLGEAEHCYRIALDVDSSNADTHVQLGHILKLLGRRSEAVTAYKRAFDLDHDGLSEAALEYRNLTGVTLNRASETYTVNELEEVHTLLSILRGSQAQQYGIFETLPGLSPRHAQRGSR